MQGKIVRGKSLMWPSGSVGGYLTPRGNGIAIDRCFLSKRRFILCLQHRRGGYKGFYLVTPYPKPSVAPKSVWSVLVLPSSVQP